ncbi:hypothetical protein PspS49_28910 [Pseudomonas sp. S49]|nr:hypothetical protein PspS49_28910 [Pseudomonas sp. S49]
MTTGRNEAGDRDERSKGRDQALHGEILENALIAPEYTGHPAACLCEGVPVRRGLPKAARTAAISCRSEPARDSGVSDAYMLTDTPLSRAGSLLQGFGVRSGAGCLVVNLCNRPAASVSFGA